MIALKEILIILFCIALSILSYSQIGGPTIAYSSSDDIYRINERLTLETDRKLYLVGERIQISCSSYEPFLQTNLSLSKIVYVEFFTSENKVHEQFKIKMNSGAGDGFVKIPRHLPTGVYYIRAYTNYMKNFGYHGFSYASVTVINPFLDKTKEMESSSIPFLKACTIYPEGGEIVYNSYNIIVCQFTDAIGKTVPCIARVLDEDEQVVTNFTTNAYGLGSFELFPQRGKKYKIESVSEGQVLETEINISDQAVCLTKLKQLNSMLSLRVRSSMQLPSDLNLVVYSPSINKRIYESRLNPQDTLIQLDMKDFDKGILQFQIRDSENQILSYRNIYNPAVTVESSLELKTDKRNYGHRSPVELIIEERGENQKINAISVSVSLIEKTKIQDYIDSQNLEYLLNSLHPFLGDKYPASRVVEDSLFLEQVLLAKIQTDPGFGESFFSDYKNLEYFPEIEQDIIFGKVKDLNSNLVPNSSVLLGWVDTISLMQNFTTNQDGKFYFTSDREGLNNMVIRNGPNSKGHIEVQDEFYPEFSAHYKESVQLDKDLVDLIEEQMLYVQIHDSYTDNGIHFLTKPKVPFYEASDKTFYIDDYIPLLTLKDFLFEVVPGLLPSQANSKASIKIPFLDPTIPYGDEPLFLVDGIPVFDAEKIGNLKCSDLFSIDVLYGKYFYLNESFDGILDIHTKKGDGSIIELGDDVFKTHFAGIQPQLNTQKEISLENRKRMPFFKSQLYWNPSVRLDEQGKTILKFITPDNNGDYLIRCTQKNTDGSVGYSYISFRVGEE